MKSIIKPLLDNRSYKFIQLENRLRCVLISDAGNFRGITFRVW